MQIQRYICGGRRKNSLNALLITLGVPYDVAYVTRKEQGETGKSKGRLYDRFSKGELLEMAARAYRNTAKRSHPDMPGGSEAKMRQLNEALDKIKRILRYR